MTRTVLLTGATGFIGAAVAAELARSPHPDRIVMLARAGARGDAGDRGDAGTSAVACARARLQRSICRFLAADEVARLLARTVVLAGDLDDPLALAAPELDSVTHVLHLASNTSFRSVRAVRRTNIFGALALAHRMRRVKTLQRFVYVSTAWVCGAEPSRVVHEADWPQPGARHFVEYTSSKAECEMLLEATAPELPLLVLRPSVVAGHTALGCAPSASIFWYYRALFLLRRLLAPLDAKKDVVPVDWAARAILELAFKPQLAHRVYHVSAGDAACTWSELAETFAAVTSMHASDPLRVVSFAELAGEHGRARIAERLGPGDQAALLDAMGRYAHFTSSAAEIFDNTRLLAEGVPPPPRFASYLAACARSDGRSVHEQLRDDV